MADNEGTEITLANGAIADSRTHVIKRGAPLSSSQARALAETRWRKAQNAAIKGLRELSTSNSALDAWKDLVKGQYQLASDIDQGRASTEAARFVGQAAGFIADRRQANSDNGGNPLEILGAEVATRILAMLETRQ